MLKISLQYSNFSIKSVIILFSIFIFSNFNLFSQLPGKFIFDTIKIKNWPAIHSFSYAHYGNYVLMLGGRIDGMHGKENGFENKKSNANIFLWNTLNDSIIIYQPDSLPNELKEFLTASNANFVQDSESLYIIGGYGESKTGIFKTYPILLKVHLKDCIESILQNKDVSHAMKYLVSNQFAVAGGQLRIMDSLFYLVGGHKFDGKYSSKDDSITQKYTDAFRIYQFSETADSLHFSLIKEIINDNNFHRRDFNLNPIITENGEIKLMVFSGVFQYNVARAFLNTVLIQKQNFEEVFDFDHKFAAYNCAKIALFDSSKNEMHQLFFGGMAEYYRDSVNAISRDAYVPFVKSVSSITRKKDGKFEEHLYPEELPGYFGTNSEFLINPKLKLSYQDIVDFNSMQNDSTYLGCIFGGIYNPTSLRNVWQNDSAHLTRSNPYILKVFFIKEKTSTSVNLTNNQIATEVTLVPNPAKNQVQLIFSKDIVINSLKIWIQDTQGRKIKTLNFGSLTNNELTLSTAALPSQNYTLHLLINGKDMLKKQLSIIR